VAKFGNRPRPSTIIERAGDCIQRKLKGATGTVEFHPGGRSRIAAALRAWTWPTRLGWLPEMGILNRPGNPEAN